MVKAAEEDIGMPVIVLFTKNVAFRDIPAAGPAQLGDQIIFTDDLVDSGNHEVGQHSGFCTRLRVIPNGPDLYQCQATLTLPEGTIRPEGCLAFLRPAHVMTVRHAQNDRYAGSMCR